jgi:hypothetical protein
MRLTVLAVTMLVGASEVGAQEEPAVVPEVPAVNIGGPSTPNQLVPLKILLTLTRYQGERKISSAPYALWVTANEPSTTRLQTGVELPVRSGASYNYRTLGTNIDCNAVSRAGGAYRLALTVTDTSVTYPNRTSPNAADVTVDPMSAQPSFRSFSANFKILLRDGQTAQYVTATDPVSGDVTKLDVALNVLK